MLNSNKIAFCAGVFDSVPENLPHAGHKFLLSEMRKLVGREGKVLIGLNSDQYVRDYKNREPLSGWAKRADALYDTDLVNEVFGFYCNPIDLITRFKPTHIFCGGDYQEAAVIGYEECKKWGGSVVIIPRIPNISTSNIIKELNNHDPK